MTKIPHTLIHNGDHVTNTGKAVTRGDTILRIGKAGYNLSPFNLEGWHIPGTVTSIPDFSKNITQEIINEGSVKAHRLTLPIDDSREFAFTLNKFRLLGHWLSLATDVMPIVNYASDGQTTISSATLESGTVASATGLAVGDWAEVDTTHLTYSGFKELTIINSINSTAAKFEPLSVIPRNTADFKKLAGSEGTGTDLTDTGVVMPDGVVINHPIVSLLLTHYLTGSRSSIKRFYPQVQITGGSGPNFNGNLAEVTFTCKPIVQPEESFTLLDGTTESRPFYGKIIYDPRES
jgi:hypothetical protein